MGKGKLMKFAAYNAMSHTFDAADTRLKGKWNELVFSQNNQPIVLELACGGGEYTVGLSELYPEKNYIGIDIKGNRMWKGARKTTERNNVAFLRQQIELLDGYFDENEVSDIWIIFPDPQPQLSRMKKRLTSPRFLAIYRKFCNKNTRIHLKTDSDLLYDYTKEVIEEQSLTIFEDLPDVYLKTPVNPALAIRTFYEERWLKENKKIKFLSFSLFKN
jgi:tRNA (guanine-N7-)-methyltransferase